MSHIVTKEHINQFLPQDKLEIPSDADLHLFYNAEQLENTIWDIAFAKLHEFDKSSWVGADGLPASDGVPSLIINAMAMWVAGSIYNKQFSEEATETGSSYGTRLKADAIALLDGVVDGYLTIDTLVVEDVDQQLGLPTIESTEPIFTTGTMF